MQPTQLASLAVYMANQPSRLGALRHANTSTGQTARQNPQALHMSSATTTSHLPAGPRDAFLSALNSGMQHSVAQMGTAMTGRPRPARSDADGRLTVGQSRVDPPGLTRSWSHTILV